MRHSFASHSSGRMEKGTEALINRRLIAIFGQSREQADHWLTTENNHLGGRPVDLMRTSEGARSVLDYLDWINDRL